MLSSIQILVLISLNLELFDDNALRNVNDRFNFYFTLQPLPLLVKFLSSISNVSFYLLFQLFYVAPFPIVGVLIVIFYYIFFAKIFQSCYNLFKI